MSRGTGKHLFVLSLFIAAILLTGTIPGTAKASNPRDYVGAVYTMTNNALGNAVIVFHRTAHGFLVPGNVFSTGGMGSGNA